MNMETIEVSPPADQQPAFQEEITTPTLSDSVRIALAAYFELLDDELPTDLHQLVISEVERPLFAFVMEKTQGNQSQAAKMLGLNRGTLRRKLQVYEITSSEAASE